VLTISSSVTCVSKLHHKAGQGDINLPVTETVDKWLLSSTIISAVLIPSSIPHNLVHNLRNRNWVSRRTVLASKTATVGVRNMTLMIRRIDILSIPARWEDNRRTNTLRAVLGWKLPSVFGITWSETLSVSETAMADGDSVVGLGQWTTCKHTESGLEGGHLVVLGAVWHVVDGHSTVLLKTDVGHLGNALEGTVLG
jgi:hypothetical protein